MLAHTVAAWENALAGLAGEEVLHRGGTLAGEEAGLAGEEVLREGGTFAGEEAALAACVHSIFTLISRTSLENCWFSFLSMV
jgi:hypothetical protein